MNSKLLEQYIAAKEALRISKDLEAQLRLEITDELLKDKTEGTHNFERFGFEIKAVKKMNYKLDEEELSQVWDEMEEWERDLIKLKPTLKLKDYKQSAKTLMLDECITVSPAMPTLEVTHGD